MPRGGPRDGVWIAYSLDGTVVVPIGSELACLRFAVAHQMTYKRVAYGDNLLAAIAPEKPARKTRRPRSGPLVDLEAVRASLPVEVEPESAGDPDPGVDCDCAGDGDFHPRGTGGCILGRDVVDIELPASLGQLDTRMSADEFVGRAASAEHVLDRHLGGEDA
jgi:hypothetical protein